MEAKVNELHNETLSKSIGETQEGLVLQIVDKQKGTVLEQLKVKSVEYSLFSLMSQILIGSIERGEIDNQFDRIMMNFAKQHAALCKLSPKLPQQDKFYFDLFSCAFNLVSQRKSQGTY